MTYQIEWVPTDKIVARAKERGMPEGEDCVLDYADEGECLVQEPAASFEAAVALAKSKIGNGDFFGQVRVERLIKIRDRWTGERLEADAVWHVHDESNPSESEPDYVPELELTEDEEIIPC